MSKLKRTSAKGAFFALAVWLTGFCMSTPAYSAVCFLPDDTGNCGTGDMNIVPDEPKKGVCDGKKTYTPEEYNEKFDDNCYTYTVGEKNGKTVYCDITKTDTKGYVLDAQDHCCQSGTAWDNKAQECCTGGKCPITCPDPQELYIIKNDICVCAYGKVNGDCCPVDTFPSNGICCPYGQEGKADGSSLICCPEDQVNKGGTCVDPVPVQTCSQMSKDYKASCPTDYTKKEAKDEKGNLVKDSNGTQCYTCEKMPNGKNPITVRLRLTCDGQACPDAIYDGDYTFYYAGYKKSQVGTRDTNNDIVITIPDWKIDDFLVETDDENTNYYNVKVSVKGTFAATNYKRKDSSGGFVDVYASAFDTSISNLEGTNEKSFEKNESGEKELIIPEDLTKSSKYDTRYTDFYVYAKVKCPGPYKEIKACAAADLSTWGSSSTDGICPYRTTDLSTGSTSDYFTGATYSTGYAKDASQCASYTLVVNGKDGPRLNVHKIDKTYRYAGINIGNSGFMEDLGIDNFKEVDISKLKDDEELVQLTISLPTGSSYAGAKYSLKVTPMNTGHVIAQPDMGNWGDKSGKEYAFVGNNGKISVGESQTIPLKLDNKALYTYVSGIKTMHPVIRLRAVVDTISPKKLKSGGSTYSMPYAYKSFRRLPNPSNGGVDLAQVSYEHWVTQNGEVCSDNALNVYVTASRNVLSKIETSLQDFGINANVVMEKGDIITYPEYGPWCMNLHPSHEYCYNYCECDSKDDYNTGCASCVRKCEAGNLNSGVTSFLAKYAKTDGAGNYTTYNQRQISSGPTQSGYVYNDGAIYIFESGFNISEDGTTGSKSESDYETCYNKTCEDFGLSSNLQAGMKCKNAVSKCNLNCFKCAYEGCYSNKADCSGDIEDQYGSISNSQVFCTTPQIDTEGIHTACERLAKNSYVQDYVDDTDSISDLSKFVEYFTEPENATSTDTRRCAVCVYTWN